MIADGNPRPPAGILIDCAVEAGGWPAEETLRFLVERAVAAASRLHAVDACTLTVLFTDDATMRTLNARFRGKDRPTNVLSFPAPACFAPPGAPRHMGDIALGYETVAREAEMEEKPFDHHLTHLVVHGFLHLLGYDHETREEAEEMENLEGRILESLAIGDPYA